MTKKRNYVTRAARSPPGKPVARPRITPALGAETLAEYLLLRCSMLGFPLNRLNAFLLIRKPGRRLSWNPVPMNPLPLDEHKIKCPIPGGSSLAGAAVLRSFDRALQALPRGGSRSRGLL